jgi:hypothetical protein
LVLRYGIRAENEALNITENVPSTFMVAEEQSDSRQVASKSNCDSGHAADVTSVGIRSRLPISAASSGSRRRSWRQKNGWQQESRILPRSPSAKLG